MPFKEDWKEILSNIEGEYETVHNILSWTPDLLEELDSKIEKKIDELRDIILDAYDKWLSGPKNK